MTDEWFPVVDEAGQTIGKALRSQCHGDPALLHPVVHCLVVNNSGQLLLQLRSLNKDVQPGKWDTSVGGHVGLGESIETALHREVEEELGIAPNQVQFNALYQYINRSPIESELVHTYLARYEGPFRPQAEEIDQVKFWSLAEIRRELGTGALTPNFEDEFARFLAHTASK